MNHSYYTMIYDSNDSKPYEYVDIVQETKSLHFIISQDLLVKHTGHIYMMVHVERVVGLNTLGPWLPFRGFIYGIVTSLSCCCHAR